MKLLGDNWSKDPVEQAQQVADQERLVSTICDIQDQVDEWELELYSEQQHRNSGTASFPGKETGKP